MHYIWTRRNKWLFNGNMDSHNKKLARNKRICDKRKQPRHGRQTDIFILFLFRQHWRTILATSQIRCHTFSLNILSHLLVSHTQFAKLPYRYCKLGSWRKCNSISHEITKNITYSAQLQTKYSGGVNLNQNSCKIWSQRFTISYSSM